MVPGLLRYFRRFARCLYRFATTYLGLTAMLIFLRCLYRFATTHLGLTAILIFLYLLVYAQVGTSLGLPYPVLARGCVAPVDGGHRGGRCFWP